MMKKTTSTTRTRKKTKRSGDNSFNRLARVIAWSCALLGLAGIAEGPVSAKKKDQAEPYALVAGTVFREPGFALPGAEVWLKPAPEAPSAIKVKSAKMISSPRGEFVFRVPAAPMRYNVTVRAQGFREQSKPVSVSGDERVDVFFRLEAESKK